MLKILAASYKCVFQTISHIYGSYLQQAILHSVKFHKLKSFNLKPKFYLIWNIILVSISQIQAEISYVIFVAFVFIGILKVAKQIAKIIRGKSFQQISVLNIEQNA